MQAESPLLHGVGDQLRPALAPQVAGHLGAVGIGDQPADLLGALRDAAVHFAGAEYGMRRAVLGGAAVDMAGLRQVDRDAARDAAERLAPADDAGDRLFVHAILQRDHVAVGRQILPDQHRRPGRVVGLHADEGDVDRLLLGELLRVGHVQRAHRHGEFRLLHGVRHAQAVLSHVLDMRGPGIDERHVLAGLHHMGAGISADRTRSDNGNLAAHSLPPGELFIVQRPLASSALSQAFRKTAAGPAWHRCGFGQKKRTFGNAPSMSAMCHKQTFSNSMLGL